MENENFENYSFEEEKCDRQNIKLKEVEKIIANKNVIIKMLQNHVRKIEESYKHNVKESETFRYKFCVAVEQIKRLRSGYLKERSNNSQKCNHMQISKEDLTLCGVPGPVCLQQIKNIENFMKTQYNLLYNLADKIDNISQTSTDCTNVPLKQINNLQEEINQLKEENMKLQMQISSIFSSKFFSNSHQLSNTELQEEIVEKESELCQEECSNKKNSFETVENSVQMIKPEQLEEELKFVNVSESQEEQNCQNEIFKIFEKTEETNEKCVNSFKDGINNQNNLSTVAAQTILSLEISNENLLDALQLENNNLSLNKINFSMQFDNKITTQKSIEEENQTVKIDDMFISLNNIDKKVTEMLEAQATASKEVEVLKFELADLQDSTKVCAQSVSKLIESLDEKSASFCRSFQGDKNLTDQLVEINKQTCQCVNDLKSKMDKLLETVEMNNNNNNNNKNDVDNFMIAEGSKHMNLDDLTKKWNADSKKKYSDFKKSKRDSEFLCLDDFISCCDEARGSVKVNNRLQTLQSCISRHNQFCSHGKGDIHNYIKKIIDQHVKVKSSLSSIITKLNGKLRDYRETNNSSISSFCLCLKGSKNPSVCSCEKCTIQAIPQKSSQHLEIEDIYKALCSTVIYKNNKLANSSLSCLCEGTNSLYAQNEKALCDGSASLTLSERKSWPSIPSYGKCKNKKTRKDSRQKQFMKIRPDREYNVADYRDEYLISDLDSYITYLHEQLNVINNIEKRIDDMRCHIKTT